MSAGYKIVDTGKLYYLTFQVVDHTGGKGMLEVEVLYEQWRVYAR
jgi:hypothetical protein